MAAAMRDYWCETCGRMYEHYFKEYVESPNCVECGSTMSYRPSFYYTSSVDAARFRPVIIHRDSEGNIRLPGNEHAPVPPGFERVELRDLHAVRKFENEVNSKERAKSEEFRYNKSKVFDAQVAENRSAIRRMVEGFTPRGRRFYEAMREAADVKRERRNNQRAPEPNFHLEAFSFNASNREDHRDASNEWGRAGANRK